MLADAGYRSEDELRRLRERGIDGYVSVGREDKGGPKMAAPLPETRAMKRKLGTMRGRATPARRRGTGETDSFVLL